MGGTIFPCNPTPAPAPRVPGASAGHCPPAVGPAEDRARVLQLPEGFAARSPRDPWRSAGAGPQGERPANPPADVAYGAAGSSGKWAPGLARTSGLVARLLAAKMAAEHPEPPKGELQLPPPPPPGHYGAWAAQELQAKLAEIGAPIQGEELGRSRAGAA